jgi:regulator of protease activity HflC (stomatin/prohibitin superfamily)
MPTDVNQKRLDPKRAEFVAMLGLILQFVMLPVTALLAATTASSALGMARWQVAIGIIFWGLSWLHLKLRRNAREEIYELEEAERRRKRQGMESLFAGEAEADAARNLKLMDKYLAPAASVFIALLFLLPGLLVVARALIEKRGVWDIVSETEPLAGEYAYGAAVGAIFLALVSFLLGMYAAGLAREKAWSLLRAGAGNMLASSAFLFLSGVGLALSHRDWIQDWPDRIITAAVWVWIILQAAEMIINFVLDFYRPRVAGIETRPAYDSRLSGLLAEPQGLFHTFAHTMDYQFGFKVSETWFFRFLEKAFAPLILIQLITFYLLTSFVVVRPGQRAIVERWGAPRGVAQLPTADADWDKLAPPLGPGLHLKWPWPIETAQVYDFSRVNIMTVGYKIRDEQEEKEKSEALAGKIVTWDMEHVSDETKYLMPLPEEMADGVKTESEKQKAVDVLLLSGTFALEYTIGNDRPGDLYRYAYKYRDAKAALRALLEREITSYLAGADFWELLGRNPEKARVEMERNMRDILRREKLGVNVVQLNLHNVHPPAGEVGKAFQQVLASRQEKESLIYRGEIDRAKITGLAPSEADKIVKEAEGYRQRRVMVSRGEAENFASQMKASAAAPEAYRTRMRMRTLEESLQEPRKIILPRDVTVVIDDAQPLSPDMMEIQKDIAAEVNK